MSGRICQNHFAAEDLACIKVGELEVTKSFDQICVQNCRSLDAEKARSLLGKLGSSKYGISLARMVFCELYGIV